MSAPVPKPRTKFAEAPQETTNRPIGNGARVYPSLSDNSDNNNLSPQPTVTPEVLHKDHEVDDPVPEPTVSPTVPPTVPPRPPAKPPRAVAAVNTTTVQNFGNVLGELRVNLGESPKNPPEIGMTAPPSTSSDDQMSPPQRHAPPPPRPPPPAGWRPEVTEPVERAPERSPEIPDRVESHRNRPLPAIPVQQKIENPIYLSLDTYRSVAGITPSPSIPQESPSCEELREWLTEEEEAEDTRPVSLHLNSSIASGASGASDVENPYTPCPRRSDYSSSEFIGSTQDPFDDAFFHGPTTSSPPRHRSSTSSSVKNQNLYVSHQDLFADQGKSKSTTSELYDNVVEVCAPDAATATPSPISHVYVNIPLSGISTSAVDSEEDVPEQAKMKIDGSSITFVGFVLLTSCKKEKRVHCRLRNMQISFHDDEEVTEAVQGPFDIKDIYLFRQLASESSPTTYSSLTLHFGEKKTFVVTFTPEDPPNLWMFFISEAWLSLHYGLTTALRDADELSICGAVWIKHGATAGEWTSCSAGINKLALHYMLKEARDRVFRRHTDFLNDLVDVDLRKVMTVREKVDKTEFCPHAKHKRGPFSMTLHGVTLYVDSRDETTTNHWFETIQDLLKRPASRLEHYRLTDDNVPVIVSKCIRFVSAYGMKSEGLYRRNGKVTEAKTILAKLTEDPIGYHLVRDTDETVYAVADVLRQFFRRLEEPLFPPAIQAALFELSLESASDSLWTRYSSIISNLPTVYLATLKKLVGHLRDVSELAEQNRASVENLGKVFGASLFLTDSMEQKVFSETYNQQINTMIHLITGYDVIFQITVEEEISRQIVNDAEKKAVNAKKPPADFLVSIHIWEKDNRPFNVKMSLAGGEVCREAAFKRDFDGPRDSPYAVFECLANGALVRRIPAGEKMSISVMQQLEWNCKDAFLLFDHDKLRFDGNDMSCFTGKIKIAEPGSKTFKSYEVKIENGTSVIAFRHEKPWKSWKTDAILWYIGTETARKPPNAFNVTMIPVARDENSSHGAKFLGYCFSFKEEADRSRWMTALTHFTKTNASDPLVYI